MTEETLLFKYHSMGSSSAGSRWRARYLFQDNTSGVWYISTDAGREIAELNSVIDVYQYFRKNEGWSYDKIIKRLNHAMYNPLGDAGL